MNIQEIEIDKLIPYHNNPRKNQAVNKVASSLKEYGFQQPIVTDKDLVLIVGHTRLLAAKKLGRIGYGIEIDPKYVDVIIQRWQDFTGKKAIHEKTNKTFDEMKKPH